ncbi:hypothetical protein H4582DRAFT_2112639 [Lactarius indigo]|nr:hypothetical protein H4582DRAFT_2112639 [Lactarius indigo]
MPQEIPPLRLEDVFDYDSDEDPDFVPCGDLDELDGEVEGMDEPDLVNPPIQEAARQASNLRNQGRSSMQAPNRPCNVTVGTFSSIDFLHALSWGKSECITDNVVCYHRTALFQNDLLLHTLRNWSKPPSLHKHRGTEVLKTFAMECVTEVVQEEMKTISEVFQPGPNPLSLASLTSFNFSETATRLKNDAPVLWHILKKVGWSVWQARQNTHKTPENAFDALHTTGLTMSIKWTSEAFKKISRHKLELAQIAMWSQCVFSMWVDKENHFYSATMGTIWALPKSVSVSPNINEEYQHMQRDGTCEAFDLRAFLSGKGGEEAVNLRVEAQAEYHILWFLLKSPAFVTFKGHGNPKLDMPPPVHQLLCGAENTVDQFIFHTADIEEASYNKNMRHMDYVLLVVGWFHLAQYLGTPSGIGLWHTFDLMNQKNLAKPHVKGPYWHHLDEALWHIAKALSLAGWLHVSGADKLEDLTSKTPEELVVLAKCHSMMFLADILVYCDLHEAITIGDVGQMEDLLKPILLQFAGGENPKYTIEVLEVLQGLKCEWTPEVVDLVRNHCWLVNCTGKHNSFVPMDQAQEQNIHDIKVTYCSVGPGATLEHLIISHGGHHSSPNKARDLTQINGHKLQLADDRAKDVVTLGLSNLSQKGAFQCWWDARSFKRLHGEKWM